MNGVRKKEAETETESEDSLSNFEGFFLVVGAFFALMSVTALIGLGVAALVSQ